MARLYTPSSSSCCRSSWRVWRLWWGNGDGTPDGGSTGATESARHHTRKGYISAATIPANEPAIIPVGDPSL